MMIPLIFYFEIIIYCSIFRKKQCNSIFLQLFSFLKIRQYNKKSFFIFIFRYFSFKFHLIFLEKQSILFRTISEFYEDINNYLEIAHFQATSNIYNQIKRSGMSQQFNRSFKNRSNIQSSDQQYSFEGKQVQKSLRNSLNKFDDLFAARDRFIAFVNQIEKQKHIQIREDILIHCEQNSKKEKTYESYLNDQMILRLINLRIQKMIKNKRIKKNWSDEDVQILIWIISKYCDYHEIRDIQKNLDQQDWQTIATFIPGVTPQSCMFKWLSLKKINLATNNWSEQESELLKILVRQSGFKNTKKDTKDWKAISQKLYFSSNKQDKIYRNAKQCRQHWNCYLNPNLKKGPWKRQQDILLLKCIKQNRGSKKWSQIVRHFDGRTQNALKNRYTLIVQKQKKQNKHKSQLEIIEQYLEKCYLDQFTNQANRFQSQNEDQDQIVSIEMQVKQKEEEQQNKNKQNQQSSIIDNRLPLSIFPEKIKVIDFKSMLEFSKWELKFMQPGKLSNGIFQKSKQQLDQTQIGTPINLFKLKKYNSSLF